MKNAPKFVFKIAFAAVLLFGFTSCVGCENDNDSVVKADEVEEMIIPNDQAKELYDSYTVRREGLIRDFENAQDSVGNNNAYDDYDQKEPTDKNQGGKAQQKNVRSAGEGFKVVRYGFYDFDGLKKYMSFIEQEAERANVDISTLRVYFANYPDKNRFVNDKPVKEPRRNTFIMVPTLKIGDEEFAFFTADDADDGQRKAFLLTDEFDENGKSYRGKDQEKASIYPNISAFFNPPFDYQNAQSLSGNEWGLRPPKSK